MTKVILGLDPGLATLGFGAIVVPPQRRRGEGETGRRGDGDLVANRAAKTSAVDFGVIQTPASEEMGDRLCTIYDDLHTLLDQIKPDLVAVEKLFFYRMANTILVAQARGVLLLVLAQHKLPIVEYTPAQIKQALTGYGNADKQEVQLCTARELNLSQIPQPDDAADALAVALTAQFNLCH